MPINASPQYYKAYGEYLAAHTTEERIEKLKIVITLAPKHKGSEKLLAQLRGRLAKLKKELVREKTKKKGRSKGVKKEGDAQIIILGFTNSGKSTLLSALTNAKPKISEIPFTTIKPEIGSLNLGGIIVQLVELPAYVEDKELLSIARASDLIVVLVSSLNELIQLSAILKRENVDNKKLFILNKIDCMDKSELDKLQNINIIKISAQSKIGIEELKQKIFDNLELIRIYTKEPGKKPKMEKPLILKKDSTVKEMARKIRDDFVSRFKSAKVWGTSVRFQGQNCGLQHVLHDKDMVEMCIE